MIFSLSTPSRLLSSLSSVLYFSGSVSCKYSTLSSASCGRFAPSSAFAVIATLLSSYVKSVFGVSSGVSVTSGVGVSVGTSVTSGVGVSVGTSVTSGTGVTGFCRFSESLESLESSESSCWSSSGCSSGVCSGSSSSGSSASGSSSSGSSL